MRTRRLPRCPDCGLSENLCICASLPVLAPETRVRIVAHRVELVKTTNTGKLVARMLGARAQLVTHDTVAPELSDPRGTWLLFPSEDALPLPDVAAHVTELLVPDGTWAQTRRIARRHVHCKDLRKVRLVDPPRSRYSLRRSRVEQGLCTLEAVAHALRVLEGDACADALLAHFEQWVARALLVRSGAHAMVLPNEAIKMPL